MGAQQAIATPQQSAEAASTAQLERVAPRLAVEGLCLTLGRRVVLDDVALALHGGEVLGILGPNGCGKTSLLRCVTGILKPDRGVIRLNGTELTRGNRRLRSSTGVVFQEPSLDPHLSAEENLQLGAALFGISRAESKYRASELLGFMGLADRAKEPVKTFSGGMQRRLELARALIHRPDVLILDEPTTGLDPHALEKIWSRLLALRRHESMSLVLSTHRADEAERCDRLVVMDRGHVVAVDTPEELMAKVSGDVIQIRAPEPEHLFEELTRLDFAPQRSEDGVIIESRAGHELIPRIVEMLPEGRIESIAMRRPTLSDAFFKMTGRQLLGEEKELA